MAPPKKWFCSFTGRLWVSMVSCDLIITWDKKGECLFSEPDFNKLPIALILPSHLLLYLFVPPQINEAEREE